MTSLVLCLVLAGAPVVAQAQPSAANTERAREAFGAAQKLYQAGRFADALKKFEAAQALKPHPVIIFNIARCKEQLGALPEALGFYREYLRLSPDAADRDAVLASIASLEQRTPKTSQQLVINVEPAGSVVTLDGKRLGPPPVTVEVSAGEHSLGVTAEGYEPLERSVTVAAQRTVELNLTLRPRVVAVADAPKKDPVLTPDPAPPMPPLVVSQPADSPRRRTFTWIAAGTAVAAAAAATGMGVGANATVADLRSGDGTRTREQAGALADQAQGLATGTNVAWGLAGAAAITAVVLFFVEGAPASP